MREKAIDKTLDHLYNQIAKLEVNKPFYYKLSKRMLEWEVKRLERARDGAKDM